jgi:RNA polymerase-binding transcription factor DksA
MLAKDLVDEVKQEMEEEEKKRAMSRVKSLLQERESAEKRITNIDRLLSLSVEELNKQY